MYLFVGEYCNYSHIYSRVPTKGADYSSPEYLKATVLGYIRVPH